jgi:site-specific DNA-methyltransferase (adenine-specific)
MGSGTTALAARRTGRHFVGFELNQAYCEIIQQRLAEPEVPAKKRAVSARKKDKSVVDASSSTVIPAANGQNEDNDITQGTTP